MLFLDALANKNLRSRPPVWLMRQAGRYMHEYQELRKRYDLLTLFTTPELIAKVTILPIEAFGLDAAILFSDILLVAKAFGLEVSYEGGVSPKIYPALTKTDLQGLFQREDALEYVFQGICLLKSSLKVPLIGFAGAPFTIASYFIEGGSSQKLEKTKKWLFEDPESFALLLDILAEYTIGYLNRQIEAGVDAVQIFDSWAHELPQNAFEACSLRIFEKILRGLKPCPVILFCKNSSRVAAELTALCPQALSIDWQGDIAEVRKRVGRGVCLQGNLDPDILLTNPQTVKREVRGILQKMDRDPAFIFNLGHGILPNTPRENVEALISCVHDGYQTA